ncbi:MAG: AI-2E family transporter [Acidimicrobiales bacterium]
MPRRPRARIDEPDVAPVDGLDVVASAERRAGDPDADPARERIRLAPIVGAVVFVVAAVVLARAAVRLTDIVGLVLFAAAAAWLVTPLHARMSRRVGAAVSMTVIVTLGLVVALGVGALLLHDLRSASDALVARLERLDAAGGSSWSDRLRRSLRIGEGVSNWVSTLPGSVVADDAGGPAIGRRVVDLIVVVVLTGFFLAGGPTVVAACVGRWPRPERERVWSLLRDVDRRAGGYLRRASITMATCATVVAAVVWAIGCPAPVALGLWAGFWLSVPTVGWIVAGVPLVVVGVEASPVQAACLAALVVVLALGTRSLRARRVADLRPGAAVVTVCLAAGVAASGGALALLFVVVGVVLTAVATSPHRVAAPLPARDRRSLTLGPVVLPGGLEGVAWASAILVATVVVITTIARASTAVVWIVTALLIAVAAERPVGALHRRAHMSRRVATALFLLLTTALFASLLGTLVAQGPASASRALTRLPDVIDDLERAPVIGRWLADRDAAATITDQLDQLPGRIANSEGTSSWYPTLGAQLTGLLWVLLLVTAIMVDGPRLAPAVERLVPARLRRQYRRLAEVTFRALAGYAAGAVLVSTMNGVVAFVLALALQLGLAPVLALWAFLWDFVPQVGGFVGGAPLLLFALVAGTPQLAIATVVYLVYQLVESNIIFPAIIGDAVDIPGWAAMVAALAGAAVAGIVGAIVLTPLVGVVKLVVVEWRRPDFPGRTAASLTAATEAGVP